MTPESSQERPDQNKADAAEAQKLNKAGLVDKGGVWEANCDLGKSPTGTDITTVKFQKVHDVWQWTNNSEPAGKWLGSPRFPTSAADLPSDVKANREKMNKLADALGVKANAQLEGEQALQAAADDYLAKEKVAADAGITPDVEYHVSWIDDSLGYLPFLEHVLEEMKDKDEYFGDGGNEAQLEKNLLQSIAQSIRRNMKNLSDAMNASPVKSGKAYEHLRAIYVERAKRYTELVGSVNEDEENVELRNATLVVEQAQEMIPNMNIDEAIDWVQQTLSSIDGNNWQSGGLKETYGKLINTCKAGLQKKLEAEKENIGGDPARASAFCRHAMELAKLFTDRGSPIDSDLTDIDFAEGMAKDAMGFEELAMRYVEKQLGIRNPLKTYVAEKKGDVQEKISKAPDDVKNNPQVIEMMAKINGNPTSVTDITDQYATLRLLEAELKGEGAPDIQGEINRDLLPVLEGAYVKFETFLDGTIGGAATLGEINAAIGDPPLSPMQVEAWQLLSDIQGYGYDVSDKTWSYVAIGAKIAAMIAAGIAVGIATGGLGVVAAMLAGGAAMTGVNAVINQQGFDSIEDAFKTYGKDFAINAATMGAARYLAAGRTAFQLSRAGLLKDAGGLSKVFSIAGKAGGAKLLGSLDDASSLGTRLIGATAEGTADLVVGTSLDTAIKGGEFMENLKGNAMFFGLSFAEFGQQGIGGLWRKLRSAPDSQLHGLSQLVNKANLGRMNIHKLSGGIHVEDLLSSADPTALLKKGGVDDKELKQIFEELDGLKKTKAEFEAEFKKAAALPDAPDAAVTKSDEERIDEIKQSIMALPDTPEGLVKRVESGAKILGMEPADVSAAQRQAILDAHAVPMADGQKYSPAELKQKMQILEAGGFTREQADTLLRMGVCGVAVPPPPPVPKRPSAQPDAPGNTKPSASPAVSAKPSDAPSLSKLEGIKKRITSGGRSEYPTPNPDAITFTQGAKVWLTKDTMVGNTSASPGLYTLVEGGKSILVRTQLGSIVTPITPKIRSLLAPVKDLQAESIARIRNTSGWKLHLNFDPQNPASVRKVDETLKVLKDKGIIADYKIGKGGGVASGQPGKESTVYIGDGEMAREVSAYLEQELKGTLLPPAKEVIGNAGRGADDTLLAPNVAGRFDLAGDDNITQYGEGGIPFLKDDVKNKNLTSDQKRERARAYLERNYGPFFSRPTDGPAQAAKKVDFGGKEQEAKVKELIMDLPETPDGLVKRLEAGAFVLGLKQGDLSAAQQKAILDAHAITMADGRKYSPAELKQKMQILEQGGFTRDQADTLLRMGVCGSLGKEGLFKNGTPLFAVNMQSGEITLNGVLDGPVAVGKPIRVFNAEGKEGFTSPVVEITGPNAKGNMVAVTASGSRYELIPNIERIWKAASQRGTQLTLQNLKTNETQFQGPLLMNIEVGKPILMDVGGEVKTTSIVTEITGPNADGHMIAVTASGSRYALIADETPNINRIPVSKPVPQRAPFTEGQEVYVVRNNGVAERGWFINQKADGTWQVSNPRQKLDKAYDPDSIAHIHEIEQPGVEPGTMPKHKGLEAEQRKFNALKNANMSQDTFRTMFNGTIRQSDNVGNCYLIAAFNSLRSSPHFEAIIRTSVDAKPDGSYTVKLPLGGKDPRKEITVLPKDLEKQKDFDRSPVDNRSPVDMRTSLHPVVGGIGWKVLEAAYAKSVAGGVMDRKAMEGGLSHNALSELFGKSVKADYIGNWQAKLKVGHRGQVTAWLDNFSNGKDLGAINSQRSPDNTGHEKSYTVTDAYGKTVKISYSHAYSVESVDKFSKLVTIKNPHDTSIPMVFTYDQLMDTFHDISTASIDFNNFF